MKICDDDLLFVIASTKYIDIICFGLLVFSIIFIILIKNNVVEKFVTNKFFVTTILVIFASTVILFLAVINSSSYKGCSCKIKINKNSIQKLHKNKVIIIGDSRMSLINDDYKEYDIPSNYEFIALSGAKIDWFVNDAISKLEEILDKNSNKYRYHVVVNMGVNDLSHIDDAKKKALEYFDYYKSLALKYPCTKFYLLSVNPINKRIMEYRWSFMDINNSDIDKFNDTLKKNVKKIHPVLLYYCNSNSNIEFKTYDGLHYKHETSQKIVDYIKDKCVKV